MKVSVLQENLNKIVGAAARAAASRPQMPILANILLRAEKGRLTAIGTDATTTVGMSTGGKIEKTGAIAVSARDMAALVGNLPPGRVDLLIEEKKLEIRSGRVKAILVGVGGEEFPEIAGMRKKGFSLAVNDFLQVVGRTLFCVSSDEGRPILTGVKIEAFNLTQGQKGLKLTATDGYRLSVVILEAIKGDLETGLIVPGRTLSEVLRLAAPKGGQEKGKELIVGMTDEGGIQFKFEEGWVAGKLLAGEFPAVDQILPKQVEMKILIDRAELDRAVRVAAIFARESANVIKFKIQNGKLKISANSPQIGENETVIEVEAKGKSSGSGERRGVQEIAFNSRYLLDYLASVAEVDQIELRLTGALKPGLFQPEGDESYTHVIMPVRVQ